MRCCAGPGSCRPKTLVFDVEPLVAYWNSGQQALDQGVGSVLARARAVPGVLVVCFSTNSFRRPSAPLAGDGVRAVYLAQRGQAAADRVLPGLSPGPAW